MKLASLLLLAALAAGCSRQPEKAPAAPSGSQPAAPRQITEDQALALLMAQLKARRVDGLECLSFMSETDAPPDARMARWEFAAREIHDDKCGGDPAVAPVRDRYRVDAAGKVLVYNVAEADYAPL